MFQNSRYITRGIQAEIPAFTTMILWEMIETARQEVPLDYLQVFRLYPAHEQGVTMQKVIHTQEQPPYRKTLCFPCENPVRAKIFCIDDETHSTMLLADEY